MNRTLAFVAIFAALALGLAGAQEASGTTQQAAPVVLDRVVAIINGDVLLQSDVQEEQRFAALEPFSVAPGTDTLQRAARRLANRTLILQQMKAQQQLGGVVTDEQVQKALTDLRNHLPKCRQYRCETAEGWKAFLAANDLTEDEVVTHWRQRLAILRFIDLRFRSGLRISDKEIEAYYKKSVLPVYERQHEKPPALSEISERIREVLLQQHVNGLLQDWLKSLRDEGSVQILDPAYGQSSGNPNAEDDN
jgi:peptidyl-prolyl cis-trans isomerase SurA